MVDESQHVLACALDPIVGGMALGRTWFCRPSCNWVSLAVKGAEKEMARQAREDSSSSTGGPMLRVLSRLYGFQIWLPASNALARAVDSTSLCYAGARADVRGWRCRGLRIPRCR